MINFFCAIQFSNEILKATMYFIFKNTTKHAVCVCFKIVGCDMYPLFLLTLPHFLHVYIEIHSTNTFIQSDLQMRYITSNLS